MGVVRGADPDLGVLVACVRVRGARMLEREGRAENERRQVNPKRGSPPGLPMARRDVLMRSAMWEGSRVAAVAVAAAVVVLLVGMTGGTANADASSVLLSDLQSEFISFTDGGGSTYEVSVRVESASSSALSVEIGFFYTEERTRRHNLIGIATVVLMDTGDWVRPGIRWNTEGLNPGLYKLRAVVMNAPGVSVENQRDDGGYDYVAVLLQDAGLVWPPQEVRLVLTENQTIGEEILCSMDWDRLDGYPTPTASLPNVWNVGSKTITASETGGSQLLVRGVVSLLGEDGVSVATSSFDFGGSIEPTQLEISPGTPAPTLAVKRVDVQQFVRAAVELYVEQERDKGDVQLRLGSPISIRTALEFTTSDIDGKSIARSLQSFRAFLPASTDPTLPEANVFSLYTDVEDYVFPRQGSCSTSPDTAVVMSSSVPPVASIDTGVRWNTYVVATEGSGDKIYLLSRRGQYGGIYGSPVSVFAREGTGATTAAAARITSRPAVGVGADPSSGFSKKPVLFFCADDGYLRAFMDLGTSFSRVWNPDGWTANAVQVPVGQDLALSPPAVMPRPQIDRYVFQQDSTEYAIVGSSQGLYVYRLEFGGTTGQALFRAYEGYDVSTELTPFAVKRGAKRLVYFFARKDGETVTRLWAVDLSTTLAPSSVVLLVGGDTPSTEITAAKTSEVGEDLTYIFFGTRDGKIYAVNTTAGTVGDAVATVPVLGSQIIGVKSVVSSDGTEYHVYANTTANRLFHLVATTGTSSLRFSAETAYSPPYSNEYLMGPSLEILPGESLQRPGMLFLSYQGGPAVALDLASPDTLLMIDAWAGVWNEDATRPTELTLTPFEFFGCDPVGCEEFGAPIVMRSGGGDRRLLLPSASGTVYAFDLTASIGTADSENTGTITPISP
jgi:hypothetical protein